VLGSAGGPRKALDLLPDDDFFIINGDTLTNIDLQALADHHRQSEALVTMALVRNRWPGRYGGVVTDAGGRVYGFVPAGSPAASYHFPGVQMAHRSVFADLTLNQPAESIGGVYQALIAQKPGSVRGYPCAADFWDVGTPADYLDAALSIGKAEGHASVQIGKDSRVDGSALIAESVIWENVEIGADVTLDRCVVADNVKIPAGVSFQNCAIIQQGETLVVSNIPQRGRDAAIKDG
jgi:NDP-sugar pyrophosphorylase family protein